MHGSYEMTRAASKEQALKQLSEIREGSHYWEIAEVLEDVQAAADETYFLFECDNGRDKPCSYVVIAGKDEHDCLSKPAFTATPGYKEHVWQTPKPELDEHEATFVIPKRKQSE